YGLDDLVRRSIEHGSVDAEANGDEQAAMAGLALSEASGRKPKEHEDRADVSGQDVVVLGSGNLGLIYLMDRTERLTLEDIDELHPRLIPALRSHPHVGW